MKFLAILGLLLYLWCTYVNSGFILAHLQNFAYFTPELNRRWWRSDLAVAILASVFPPMWFVCLALTGFYQHGWTKPRWSPQS